MLTFFSHLIVLMFKLYFLSENDWILSLSSIFVEMRDLDKQDIRFKHRSKLLWSILPTNKNAKHDLKDICIDFHIN